MTMTFNKKIQQPAPGVGGATRRPAFRFAPTFVIDLIFSSSYVILFAGVWARAALTVVDVAIAGVFGLALVLCYVGKVMIISFLADRGGDARTYVISSDLVTTGLYAYSRNPTYLVTLIQCLVWSALLLFLESRAPVEPIILALTVALPALFFLITDRVIITREDAALRTVHPEAFDAYAESVGRWFGRKRRRDSGRTS
jgi:protein-S-isoprenylcysteine O-methyltransferase Ste14